MPFISVLAVIVLIGYITVTGLQARQQKSNPSPTPQVESAVSEVDPTSNPSLVPSSSVTISPKPKPSSTTSDSQIKINVDTQIGDTTSTSEKLIYSGAVSVGGNQYETSAGGNSVYDWYKIEMNKRSYQIRNNVKTQANDKFKAVLQGVSGSTSLKVTIDQENAAAKTIITLE